MILNALVEYYDRLAADSDQDIAPFGFSRQKISFEVVLGPDGSLAGFQDARIERDGRRLPRLLVVPGQAKPPGSGLSPCFLWDNAAYLLGFKADDPNPNRTQQAFEAFRKRHLALEEEIGDQVFSAVCAFLRAWKPADAAKHPELVEIVGAFGVFRIQGAHEYLHERPKAIDYWRKQIGGRSDGPIAPSLISGEEQPIARLHEPKIKGVIGAQSAGATIISFNLDAFKSYHKEQNFNAPVGIADAFRYCTALDRLTSDANRRVLLGDTTVVFWSNRPTAFESVFGPVLDTTTAEDAATLDRLRGFFSRLNRVVAGERFDDADMPFYVLGLSPNAARLSVRFWQSGTVQQFAERLGQHIADLELAGAPKEAPPLTIRRMLDETARERKDIRPLLSGAVMRAILSGGPYPQSLFSGVLTRIHADARVSHPRVAILKAFLLRKARLSGQDKEIPVSLNKDHPEAAYHIGRLFAVLEKTQEEAFDNKLNSTIKDRYFSSASSAPVAVMPRILRLHAYHLNKIENPGRRTNLEKLVQEICTRVDGFPGHLPLDEQGLFFIGYYHQRQDLFTRKSDSENDTANSEEE